MDLNCKISNERIPLVSVIVPVYNGQKYLDRLLLSFKNQTLENIEILLINDESTDDSLDILKRYADGDSRFRLFSKTNDGRSSATKVLAYGLPLVRGKYFFYVSQDDFLSEDLLKNLYDKAIETQADAVIPDEVVISKEGNQIKRIGPPDDNYELVLSGKQAFIKSLLWGELSGFSLRKTALVQKIGYDTSIVNGDDIATRKYYLQSNKVVFSKGTFYYFVGNPNAITKQISWRLFDWMKGEIMLMEIIRYAGLGKELEKSYTNTLSVNYNQRCQLYFKHKLTLIEDEAAIRRLMIDSTGYVLKACLDSRLYLRFIKNIYWYLCMKTRIQIFAS